MRHRNTGRKLGRNASHRKALWKNMSTALLTYGRITTTEAKAKEIRGYIEPLITLAQKDDLHSRRQAYKFLCNHKVVQRLFDEIGPNFKDIPGGYTRIVKLAIPRKGDCAPMAIIELIRGNHLQAAGADAAVAEAPKAAKKAAPKKAAAYKPAKKPAAKKAAAPKAEKTEGESAE